MFDKHELDENSTVKNSLTVQSEDSRNVERNVKDYNLDMVISLRYRINLKQLLILESKYFDFEKLVLWQKSIYKH